MRQSRSIFIHTADGTGGRSGGVRLPTIGSRLSLLQLDACAKVANTGGISLTPHIRTRQQTEHSMAKIKKLWWVPPAMLILVGVVFVLWASAAARPMPEALAVQEPDSQVQSLAPVAAAGHRVDRY